MTDQLRDRPDEGDEPPHGLMDVRCFALAAVAVGVLLYVKPAAGLAVLGAVTVLAALARLVRR
jgi:hypothetical protein